MTQYAIEEQIAVIKSSTKKALESKKAAQKFLIDAGIIQVTKASLVKSNKKKK